MKYLSYRPRASKLRVKGGKVSLKPINKYYIKHSARLTGVSKRINPHLKSYLDFKPPSFTDI